MVIKSLLFSLTILIATISCSSSGKKHSPAIAKKKKPAWYTIAPKTKKGNSFYFVGEADGAKSEKDAKEQSFSNGLALVSNSFGVKINSQMISKTQESDGNYNYDIGIVNKVTGVPVTIKNYKVEETFTEIINGSFSAKTLLSIPESEMSRIQMEMESLCGFGFVFDKKLNQSIFNTFIKEFAKLKKLNLKPVKSEISPEYTTSSLKQISRTAYFMAVKVSSTEPKNIEGEWYTNVTILVELLSLVDSKVIDTFSAESKGAAFSAKDALSNGYKKAIEQIMFQ